MTKKTKKKATMLTSAHTVLQNVQRGPAFTKNVSTDVNAAKIATDNDLSFSTAGLGFLNLQTGYGTSRDRRAYSAIADAASFQNPYDLEALYHGNDVAQRIIDVPVREMLRQGYHVVFPGDTNGKKWRKFERYLNDLGLPKTQSESLTNARLYGSIAVFIGADEGKTVTLDQPLQLDRIKTIKFLRVIDRYQLQIARRYDNPGAEKYGEPQLFNYTPSSTMTENVTGKMIQIHESRLVFLDGTKTTIRRKNVYNRGFADSIFVRLISVLRGYDSTWAAAETLMQDFAQAVIKIAGLADMMAHKGEDLVAARMQTMDMSRSTLRALLIDQDEEFSRQATPMTGLPELLDRWLHRVAAAADMPVTLMFGTSPGGMNATGASDIQFFYDSIVAKQKDELLPFLKKLFTILLHAQDNPFKGKLPENWEIKFNPLERLSPLEIATLHKTQAEADALYLDRQALSADEVAQSRFGDGSYSLETVLNNEDRLTLEEARQQELEASNPAPDGDHLGGLNDKTPKAKSK